MDASFTFLHRTLVMTTAATRRWRPRSLLQLVLLAFVVVMLPLGVLMYQAGQALSELSRLAEVSARQAVSETRRARTLGSLAVEMERGARQYAVVQEESLLDIYAERVAEFRQLLARQRLLLPEDPDILALERLLNQLATLPEKEQDAFIGSLDTFVPFSRHVEGMRQATNLRIDQRLDAIRERAEQVQQRLWWQTGALVSSSLLLMLLFTRLIIRPVRQLERRILGIGSGHQDRLAGRVQGPAELVALGERLDWLTHRLEELEAQKQQFLRHMSHELKTPLASVREGSALLSDGVAGELSPRQREVLELIDASGAELQRLIEQLLDYNLLQHHRSASIERVDMATVAREVLAKHRLSLQSKDMQVEVFSGPLQWNADHQATARLLDNLVSNAVAYGEDGGKLLIRARTRQDRLELEVANTGDPIAEQDREHLFEAFYQGRARRKGALKGSGIGLSVAADCARLQNGRLELVDDPDWPVCFRLSLPVAPPQGRGSDPYNDTRPALTGQHARNLTL
ncbi:sensor histidine kinase [Halomonas denitrificans]|uniref:sensor histidine kinase n=1 Tax=Halomonas denitrificans TaxID=370769 RepID=UPI0021BD7EE0|nr:HAMP domain-containing sensor histidine kinase [Halomonas denitrificans]